MCVSLKIGYVLNFFIVVCFNILYVTCENNPYQILGIGKYATLQEIRHSYKQLAKEWHPDKNTSPDAEQKFVRIKQAYELLSDADRRKIYDQHGITNEDSHFFKQKHDYSTYNRFSPYPFEEFFGNQFHFDHDISIYHKLSISVRYFYQIILEKSKVTPQIIVFYNDWCFRCIRLVGFLKKIMKILEPLGIDFSTVNAIHEPQLVRKIGINDVPSVVLILDEHVHFYKDKVFLVSKFVEFVRSKIPFNIMVEINDNNINEFLSGWMDNKVRALIIEPRNVTRLRYLINAFAYRRRVVSGFVQIGRNCEIIQKRFSLHPNHDSLLIFHEDAMQPVASISMFDIPTETMKNIMSVNQYLSLPRLSSQDVLEGLCPAEWRRPRKRLCVVLITENSNNHNFARDTFRKIAQKSTSDKDRVRFAYLFKERQNAFVNAISEGVTSNSFLSLVVIWRRDSTRIKYEWISTAISATSTKTYVGNIDHIVNISRDIIDTALQKLLKSTEPLAYEALVQNLVDEHAQSILSKWISKLFYIFNYLIDNLENEHLLAVLSVVGTVAFMIVVGYSMLYFVKIEEESVKIKQSHSDKEKAFLSNKYNRYLPELKLHELRAEKYNGMIRLLKPGCRAIILITDLKTRTKLIPAYHKSVWPYRKSKTLIFGHMLIEKGLVWYSELLRLSLSENRKLNINPRNCIGTVLAINGHRKYFCMYHAKHPETKGGTKRMMKFTNQLIKKTEDPEVGTCFEIDSSDDSENDSRILLEDNLLDGLNNWLDRLFEGTTHRYYVNYWPEFPTK